MRQVGSLGLSRLKKSMVLAVATALMALAIAPSASASVPHSGWGFGIADDSGKDHMGGPFASLESKIFRIQIPWDTVPPANDSGGVNRVAEFRAILQHARDSGVQSIAVTFRGNDWEIYSPHTPGTPTACLANGKLGTKNCYPDPALYLQGITGTIDALDDLVDVWGPANEPNQGMAWMPETSGANTLGQYWPRLVSARNAKDPGAKLMSPDFHDRPDLGSIATYLNAYVNAGGRFGDYVAFHPYNGVWQQSMTSTALFIAELQAVKSQILKDNSTSRIWLTEIGSYFRKGTTTYGPTTQNARINWLIGQLPNFPQIDRVYYYNMGYASPNPAEVDADSGLLDQFGNKRPAWNTWCAAIHNFACSGGAGGPDPSYQPRSNDGITSRSWNTMNYFARGADGSLLHKWWTAEAGWSPTWDSLGGTITSEPTAYSLHSNHIAAVARGTDGQVYQRWWQGGVWSPWESLGGGIVGRPAAAVRDYNNMNLFARGTEGSIWVKWWNAQQGWSEWISLGGVLTSDPVAYSLNPNHVAVFARANNLIYQRWWSASTGWSNWESMGGSFTGKPAVAIRDPNNLNLFARGTDGAMYVKWWNVQTGWSEWSSLGGTLTSDPTAVSANPNHVAVFARGTDNKLYERWWDSVSGWSNWVDHGGSLASDPTAFSIHGQNIGVFARGTNGIIQQTWWYDPASPGGWVPWGAL